MIAGIIAEYNPFHLGHAYQIRKIRDNLGAEAIVVAMSGDFTQRGTPAIVSKYQRAQTALAQGADLVLEIPVAFATAGARSYAMAGVCTLANTGIVDTLVFGSECADMDLFHQAASLLEKETPAFQDTLKTELSRGSSYALARGKALASSGIPEEFLSQPNNILGIEYLRAIHSLNASLNPIAILRKGSPYHGTDPDEMYPSATALRLALSQGQLSRAAKGLPQSSYQLLSQALADGECVFAQDLSLSLHQALLREHDYERYADCSDDLSRRIAASLDNYRDAESFCDTLKTRDITRSHISRSLCHILLNISKEDDALGKSLGYVPYLRLLGFTKRGGALLSSIKKQAAVPMVTRVADAGESLSPAAMKLLEKDIYASDVYRSIRTAKSKRVYPTEYTRKFDLANFPLNDERDESL